MYSAKSIRPFLFVSICALAGQCSAEDDRFCATKTKDQQLAFLDKIRAAVEKNDAHADVTLPLIRDVFLGNESSISTALSKGFDPNMEANVGLYNNMPLLELSIAACQPSIALLLINSGAWVDGTTGSTPLVDAADSGTDEVVKELISHHAALGKPDFEGHTALREAVAQGHYSTVRLLLEAGADPNNSGHSGEPLVCDGGGDTNARKIAGILVQYGAKPRTK